MNPNEFKLDSNWNQNLCDSTRTLYYLTLISLIYCPPNCKITKSQDDHFATLNRNRLGKKDELTLSKRHKEIRGALVEAMADPHAKVDVMRWIPGVRRNDDVQSPRKPGQEGNRTKKKKKSASYCRKEAYRQARLALDTADAQRSSGYLVSGISRIRPTHDALHRDRFTYHGGVHTEEDDLIALQFVNTLESLHKSLSPEARRSPSGTESQVLNTEELLAKVQTLSNFVNHMKVFGPALSDDGRLSDKLEESQLGMNGLIKNLSVSSQGGGYTHTNGATNGAVNGHNGEIQSFDSYYNNNVNANGFTPITHNISAESSNYPDTNGHYANGQMAKKGAAEHGSMRNLLHTQSRANSMKRENSLPQEHVQRTVSLSPMPGLMLSRSSGHLPAVSVKFESICAQLA